MLGQIFLKGGVGTFPIKFFKVYRRKEPSSGCLKKGELELSKSAFYNGNESDNNDESL